MRLPIVPASAVALLAVLVAHPVEASMTEQDRSLPVAEYGVAAALWSAELGHHRALVQVAAPAPAVQVRIPWRRRDVDPGAKDIIVHDPSGKRVANVARIEVRREYGDIAFEAAQAGVYEVYYLPYEPEPTQFYYAKGYTPPSNTSDPAWLAAHALSPDRLSTGQWRGAPAARALKLEARSAFDSFYPMEVVATPDEVADLAARGGKPVLLFPEDRKLPIRMKTDVPVRWVERGPQAAFHGEALRNEYYAFQIGVFAARAPISNLAVTFADLRGPGGARIPAANLRSINMGGVDVNGKPFAKRVDVAQGHVQALWIGVDVPEKAVAGDYSGTVSVSGQEGVLGTVAVTLSVGAKALADRGDSELWRHSRLRWLDSSAGIDDDVVPPYTPLKLTGRTVKCLGRSLRFGTDGLPAGMKAGVTEMLAEPVRFSVKTGGAHVAWAPGRVSVTKSRPGLVAWEAQRTAPGLTSTCRAEMEFDGHVLYRVSLKADKDMRLDEAALELPFRPEVARYLMGAGRKGGSLPAQFDWRWTTPHDSFWIGDVPAGVHCELRGGSYNGPLMNLFHPAPPATWSNGGQGGVTLERGGSAVVARAYSGARDLKAGEEVTFEFALILTPVKPIDTAKTFATRYYHGGDKPIISDYTVGSGINVINVHHANDVNPYINYPFIVVDPLKQLVQTWQQRGMKVKLYYTVRELSNYMTELWALRSLGTEVLAGGGGGGFPWLREHLGGDYTTQWYVPFKDGSADAALLNSGECRWYNYYIEGLSWLCENIGMDGLYLDDVSFDRRILKRMRKVMNAARPGSMIDLHSNTAFSIGPANQYMEYMPYVDKVWFGESFRYNQEPPDYWLTEVSGIPFGVMGEMLHSPTNAFRGMIYGITNRITWDAPESGDDPRPIYRLWDAFGIAKSKMLGYWDPKCPVRTDNPDVLATAYVRKGKALIALANWAPQATQARLKIDWKALGLDPANCVLKAPAVRGVQEAREFAPDAVIPVEHLKGWMLVLEHVRR
jgi:hypothetical protein